MIVTLSWNFEFDKLKGSELECDMEFKMQTVRYQMVTFKQVKTYKLYLISSW